MREYQIVLPFSGALFLTVTAESPEEAREKAQDFTAHCKLEFPQATDEVSGEIAEWDIDTKECSGNVCGRTHRRIEVTDCGEVEED